MSQAAQEAFKVYVTSPSTGSTTSINVDYERLVNCNAKKTFDEGPDARSLFIEGVEREVFEVFNNW